MDYEKIYIEEVKIFNDISRKYDDLVEEDIAGAFELQKEYRLTIDGQILNTI